MVGRHRIDKTKLDFLPVSTKQGQLLVAATTTFLIKFNLLTGTAHEFS